LGVIPIQMANLAAIIANKGFYYSPHIIKRVDEKATIPDMFKQKNYVGVDAKYFEPIIDGMHRVTSEAGGTARRAKIEGIEVCGKTGTAQNPHGEDHSVFIAFAPKDNPKIAIAVVVENAGFGGTWAAPIASLMIEKYINDTISDRNVKYKEQRIIELNLIEQERIRLEKEEERKRQKLQKKKEEKQAAILTQKNTSSKKSTDKSTIILAEAKIEEEE